MKTSKKPKRGWSKIYEDYKPLSPALIYYAKKMGLI